jgi:hypothetical protein
MSARAFALTTVCVVLLSPNAVSRGQEPASTQAAAKPAAAPARDFLHQRFVNIAQIGPLTVLRQVPLITNAVSMAYIRGGQPFITLALMDPNDHSTDPGCRTCSRTG